MAQRLQVTIPSGPGRDLQRAPKTGHNQGGCQESPVVSPTGLPHRSHHASLLHGLFKIIKQGPPGIYCYGRHFENWTTSSSLIRGCARIPTFQQSGLSGKGYWFLLVYQQVPEQTGGGLEQPCRGVVWRFGRLHHRIGASAAPPPEPLE